MKKQLLKLIEGQTLTRAPAKTDRHGLHWTFTIEIDANNTAEMTMSDEAYEALISDGKDPNQAHLEF